MEIKQHISKGLVVRKKYMRKYFKMNKNEDKITNSWDATKAVTPRKFIAISANTKKKKKKTSRIYFSTLRLGKQSAKLT